MFAQPTYSLVLRLLALLAIAPSVLAVLQANVKEAAALSAVAVAFPKGRYSFTNVKTGQALTYVANGNHVYPASSGTIATVTPHPKGAPWIQLQFGVKDKCLSSAWGGKFNDLGVMYACIRNKKTSTLEPTKQWWLAVSTSKTSGPPKKSGAASTAVLLAAQVESVKVRAAKIAAAEKAFDRQRLARRSSLGVGEDDLVTEVWEEDLFAGLIAEQEDVWERDGDEVTVTVGGEELSAYSSLASGHLEKRGRSSARAKAKAAAKRKAAARKKALARKKAAAAAKRRAAAKKAAAAGKGRKAASTSVKGGKVIGTYFLIPSDHLIDLPTRALSGKAATSRGTKTTVLDLYSKGNKAQQWVVRKH